MKVIMHASVRKLLLAAILANYLLEFFYTVGRLVGVGLWLQPIDKSTTEGMISFELYTFELILVAQFFAIWLLSWLKKWKIHMRTSWKTTVLIVLAVITVIDVVLVFTWNAGWPGMIERRLFAFESWLLLTLLSVFVQVAFIN
jgi:hypothetical protein